MKHKKMKVKQLESSSNLETACSLRDEIFPETKVKLKLSKEKEIDQLFEIKSISSDYHKTKRKSELGKDELNNKRLKIE